MKAIFHVLGAVWPVILGIVPGWGHIWMRHYRRGLLFFVLVVAVADYALVSQFLESGDAPLTGMARSGAIVAWAISWLDIVRIVWRARSPAGRDRLEDLTAAAHELIERKSFGQAEQALLEALRLDPGHGPALCDLGRARAALGNRRGALRVLKRSLRHLAGDERDAARRELDRVRRMKPQE